MRPTPRQQRKATSFAGRGGGDFGNQTFAWNHFVMAGDPLAAARGGQGNIKGDMFSCPDGLWVDGRGVLWIQCDMSTSAMGRAT